MTPLTAWTGLAGDRDPAQPLLTLLDPAGRVELSGATTANWVAKSANLLLDGLGGPARVGLLLPLHWQAVALLLAGVASGATVVVAADAAGLADCDAAFTTAAGAQAALEVGVDDVLALSGHPLGAPCGPLPNMVTDYAREVPSYADHWGGRASGPARVEAGGALLGPLPALGLGGGDRVLLGGTLDDPVTLAVLLAALGAGAALLLVPDASAVGLERLAAQEGATATHGLAVAGLRTLG